MTISAFRTLYAMVDSSGPEEMRVTAGRKPDRRVILELFIACLLILTAIVNQRKYRNGNVGSGRDSEPISIKVANDESGRVKHQDNIAGFRLLVTILAGVALGAAASALPTLMTTSATGDLLIGIWLLWTTGVAAVILAYLSTLTGSKIIPNEIDFVHSVALIASFLAQCGLFASLVRPSPRDSVRWWLISFSAFGAAATAAILVGLWMLPRSHRKMDHDALVSYRRGQWEDATMASLTAVSPAIYLLLVPKTSDLAVLIISIISLTFMIAACIKQSVERRHLRLNGLL